MTEESIREILDLLDIEVALRTSDGWLQVSCPFAEWRHDHGTDRHPSCFVKIDPSKISGFWCHTCHSKGRLSSMARILGKYREENYSRIALRADLLETPDSFGEFGEYKGNNSDPEPISKAAYLTMFPLAWEHELSRAYLEMRGISQVTTKLLQLQYDPDEMRVLFPVFDYEQQLYGFSGRSIMTDEDIERINNSPRTHSIYRKVRDYTGLPKQKLLLGEHLIDPKKPNWILEGLFAFAHLCEIGARALVNPLAVMGNSMSQYQADLLIGHGQPAYLVFDDDTAGTDGIYGDRDEKGNYVGGGAFDLLKNDIPTFVPYYPDGISDPDNLTLDHICSMLRNV